jgi:excisionase family DNA binding protein
MSANGDIELMRPVSAGVDTIPILISAEELAKLMQVSERTLWRLLFAGKVPQPVRIGRNTRWRYAEVREWIEKGCPGTSSRV